MCQEAAAVIRLMIKCGPIRGEECNASSMTCHEGGQPKGDQALKITSRSKPWVGQYQKQELEAERLVTSNNYQPAIPRVHGHCENETANKYPQRAEVSLSADTMGASGNVR